MVRFTAAVGCGSVAGEPRLFSGYCSFDHGCVGQSTGDSASSALASGWFPD
jgi:hypothetical protein